MGSQNRAVAAVAVFLIGIGILIQVVGLLTDAFSYKIGFIGLVAAAVVAVSFLVYHRRGARDATAVFLLGLGVVLLVFGPLTDLYSYKVGFVGLVASWVVAVTLRVYYGRSSRYD